MQYVQAGIPQAGSYSMVTQAQANGESLTASTPIGRGVGLQIWIPARARDREMYI
jgi:hypothetical protein